MRVTLFLFSVFLFLMAHQALTAQSAKGEFIKGNIGLGYSTSLYVDDNISDGFFVQGEYVYGLTSWFSLRPYAAFINAINIDDEGQNDNQEYGVTASAFMLGGKFRIAAPIPFISPYIEIGAGASFGRFENYTEDSSLSKKGFAYHFPFNFGISVGKNHGLDIGVMYFIQPGEEQLNGAATIGFTIPINN